MSYDVPVINRSTLASKKVVHYLMIDGHKVIHVNYGEEGPPVKPDYCPDVPGDYNSPCCTDETCDCDDPGPAGCILTYAKKCRGMSGYCYYALDDGIECTVDGCFCSYHYAGNNCTPWE